MRIFEGPIADNQELDTLEMAAAPQIGATIVIYAQGDRQRARKITAVEHVLAFEEATGQTGVTTYETREVEVRCSTRLAE